MKEIVQKVVEALKKREDNHVFLSYKENQLYETNLFIQAKHIHIIGVDSFALADLVHRKKESTWVQFVITGLTYQVSFYFHLSFNTLHLVPKELLIKWPIEIYDKSGDLLVMFDRKAITYQQVSILQVPAKVVMCKSQLLTQLAEETVAEKKMISIERV